MTKCPGCGGELVWKRVGARGWSCLECHRLILGEVCGNCGQRVELKEARRAGGKSFLCNHCPDPPLS